APAPTPPTTTQWSIISVAAESDGSLLVAGDFSTMAAQDGFVVRLGSDGTIDTSFGTEGIVYFGAEQELAVTPSGAILIADNSAGLVLKEFDSSGTAVSSFGNSGVATLSGTKTGTVSRLLTESNGKIVLLIQSSDGETSEVW